MYLHKLNVTGNKMNVYIVHFFGRIITILATFYACLEYMNTKKKLQFNVLMLEPLLESL